MDAKWFLLINIKDFHMKNTSIPIPAITDLHQVSPDEIWSAAEMLSRAFADDPIWKEILKGHEEKYPYVFASPLKYALKYGRVYADSPAINAVAAWITAPYTRMSMWRMIRSGAMKYGMKIGSAVIKKMATTFKIIEEDRQSIINGPFFYLSVLGVHPDKQGTGLGTLMIQKMIENRLPNIPLYLETESERNVTFYQKLGFEVVKKFKVPDLELPMWELLLK